MKKITKKQEAAIKAAEKLMYRFERLGLVIAMVEGCANVYHKSDYDKYECDHGCGGIRDDNGDEVEPLHCVTISAITH